jgi:hypothetical protein
MDVSREDAYHAYMGWHLAEQGSLDNARACYAKSPFGAGLSMLRHARGRVSSESIPHQDPEGDGMVTCAAEPMPAPPENGRLISDIEPAHIQAFLDIFDPGFHADNIDRELPHVMVISTGRCGTMSLYHLLRGTNVVPHHAYWWHVSVATRWEMMCRLVDGAHEDLSCAKLWLSSRAAEWLSAIAMGKPMVALNHWDAIFAPVFMALHPRGKLVYLRRDPERVFESFHRKDQFQGNQLEPLIYEFNPGFRWAHSDVSQEQMIHWYLDFTERFATALAATFEVEEISADRLFAQDAGEIARLLDVMGADIPLDRAVAHYGTKINEKAHKLMGVA